MAGIRSKCLTRQGAQRVPYSRGSATHSLAASMKLLLCAVCCALTSVASPQILETTILLPDTLGPLNGPYCLAWDDNPAHPRLYIGGEGDSGGVIVADAITCKRLARIQTNPVHEMYFCSPYRKLYITEEDKDTLTVVDCASNQVTSRIPIDGRRATMVYNRFNDRLYCGSGPLTVIDCATDSVIRTIAANGLAVAFDSTRNRLYCGSYGALTVVDCNSDSVVATIPRVSSAIGALCYNPTAKKVYAVAGDTLFVIDAHNDSVVAQLPFAGLAAVLSCDPQRNRIYSAYNGGWVSIDCEGDTVILDVGAGGTTTYLACDVARDRLYRGYSSPKLAVYDATTGQNTSYIDLDGTPSGIGWSPGLDRLYCSPGRHLLTAIDCARDSIAGIVPLNAGAGSMSIDTVHNRLYFIDSGSLIGCIGVVDCMNNVVTSYAYAGECPTAMVYNANNNRLYWSTGAARGIGNSMTVYDCSTNMVTGRIQTSGGVRAAQLHLGLNKLYAYASNSSGIDFISVIDCDGDSVTNRIVLPDAYRPRLLLVPEDDRLWLVDVVHVIAIDCLGDSIVADVEEILGVADVWASPQQRKMFAACGEKPFSIIDMDDPAHVETLFTVRADGGQLVCYVPNAHKVYWFASYSGSPPGGNSFCRVIDASTNAVRDSFWVGHAVNGLCLDHTGDYIYGSNFDDSLLFVVDTRVDRVSATVRLPSCPWPPVLNSRTDRLYLSVSSDGILVIRDSMLIALEELKSATRHSDAQPTFVSRSVPYRSVTRAGLWDASGRRVAVLRPGANDIRSLTPAVYFYRGQLDDRTTKVVVVR
jgi:DNA-binding beta-propeller fold protein YncE